MIKIIWLGLVLLAGCAAKLPLAPPLPPEIPIEPPQLKVIDIPRLQLATNPEQVLIQALNNSRQLPSAQRMLNATTVYDYIPGSVYQVYTAPQQVTLLSLAPGESLVAAPQSGDTVRWQLNSIISGSAGNTRQHLVIKPLRENLRNNMIIATNCGRVYLLELISLKHNYMAEISWNYAAPLAPAPPAIQSIPKKLNFKYKIINQRGKPKWRPLEVFDDGEKTFIQFGADIGHHELPSLFVVSRETSEQLVNYRFQDNCFIVDRLLQVAELKLGRLNPEIIRIKRKT